MKSPQAELEIRPRRILIAGASSAIGRSLAGLLAGRGLTLGLHGRRGADALRGAAGADARVFDGDLRTRADCRALVDGFADWAGGIDALVQLTGHVSKPAPVLELSEEDWAADLQVNLSGPFFLAQRTMERMGADGGRIVLTSTASAAHGGGRTSMAYGAAKAGLECVAKGLAREGAPRGVLVNAVAPGFIDTPFHTRVMGRSPEELAKRAALVPLKRAGRPEDAARVILFLLSSGADYITGECVAVSGGDWL